MEAVAWGGEGDGVVLSGSFDASVRVWDVKGNGGRPVMVFDEARDAVGCLAVVGKEVFAGGTDGRVRVYDLRMGVCSVDVVARGFCAFEGFGGRGVG